MAKINPFWVPPDKIDSLIHPEPAMVLIGMVIAAWAIYKFLLRDVSEERHRNLQGQFRNLSFHLFWGTLLFVGYYALVTLTEQGGAVARLEAYIGLIALISAATIFIKCCRILVFEYLFLSHMRVGVPLLLVNLFTLMLTLMIGGWMAAEIFNIQLAPLLATSAIFSLVLGLALQDTLGNLFAGVAMQFDKPYELGDWVEIQIGSQKVVGQVQEVSWRATVLQGFGDEFITVPNRLMAQTNLSNYATRIRPIIRSHVFRIGFGSPLDEVKKLLIHAAESVNGVRSDLPPLVLLMDTTESWLVIKLIYYIENFGAQYVIGDQVLGTALLGLEQAGIPLASSRLQVATEHAAEAG